MPFAAIIIAGILAPLGLADDAPTVEAGRSFWAFQSITDPPTPTLGSEITDAHPIDAFDAARKQTDLASDEPLSAEKLVRKLYLDLHGLPPTPAQIDAFLADTSPAAYQGLVDELLASRRFAERWARHWLSVVRYADSTGGGRAILLQEAWRYRDYVVDSFHHDRPYADFVTDQIAGDLLNQSEPKDRRDSIVATGFLAMGPTNYELQNKEQLRMDVIDEQIDTVGRAFMGLSLGCARCHDHFFDPIPTADYYALAGIFGSTKTLEHSNVSNWINTDLPPVDDYERQIVNQRRNWETRISSIRSEIAALKQAERPNPTKPRLVGIVVDDDAAEFEGSWIVSTFSPGFVGDRYLHDNAADDDLRAIFRRRLPVSGEYEVRIAYTSNANRAPAAQALIKHANGETPVPIDQRQAPELAGFKSLGAFTFDTDRPAEVVLSNAVAGQGFVIADAVAFVPLGEIADAAPAPPVSKIPAVAKLKRKQLEGELKELEKTRPPLPAFAMSVIDEKKPTDCAINIGGSITNLGETVPRGFLQVLNKPGTTAPEIPEGHSGRLELARWLTSDEHPLLARVYANRCWLWLTGTGIVATPDDFGSAGDRPSNPELLDHLASRLLQNGGSTKELVRYIVGSKAYQTVGDKPRRIDAETLHDAMLAVSRELDLSKEGGPAMKKGTTHEFGYRFDRPVRSLYLPVFRNNLPEILAAFDFPDPSIAQGHRADTTLATQALYMMNHPWVIDRSQATAKHYAAGEAALEAQVRTAYRTTLSRPPSPTELELAEDFLGDAPDLARWTAFQQALFSSIDFRFY